MHCVRWLPGQDSNLGQRIQSPLCYHYTTGQRRGRAMVIRVVTKRLQPADIGELPQRWAREGSGSRNHLILPPKAS